MTYEELMDGLTCALVHLEHMGEDGLYAALDYVIGYVEAHEAEAREAMEDELIEAAIAHDEARAENPTWQPH